MRWARAEFERVGKTLIETYHYEYKEQTLFSKLKMSLEEEGVEIDRFNYENFVKEVFRYNQKERAIYNYFKEFIRNIKTYDVSLKQIEENIDVSRPRQYHFAKCGIILYQEYSNFLSRNNMIDFDDMITEATEILKQKPDSFKSNKINLSFRHILKFIY
jgi:DNA helicase-4